MHTSAVCSLAIPLAVVFLLPAGAGGAPPAGVRVDHAVVPAGGGHGACCGAPGCRHHGCRHTGGHHADCRDGHCVPYCPVRPGQFGFYGTQWRRWPGTGVVPASGIEAATPVAPPRLEVPGPDEESPRRPPGDTDPTDDPTDERPAEGAAAEPAAMLPPAAEPFLLDPQPVGPQPASEPEPAAEPLPRSETRPEPELFPAPSTPEPSTIEPSIPAPADAEKRGEAAPAANPFDEASTRGWRKFLTPVSGSMPIPVEPQANMAEPQVMNAVEQRLVPVVPPVRFDHLDEVRAAESAARGRKISVATPK